MKQRAVCAILNGHCIPPLRFFLFVSNDTGKRGKEKRARTTAELPVGQCTTTIGKIVTFKLARIIVTIRCSNREYDFFLDKFWWKLFWLVLIDCFCLGKLIEVHFRYYMYVMWKFNNEYFVFMFNVILIIIKA